MSDRAYAEIEAGRLPNPEPGNEESRDALKRIWAPPRGLSLVTAVNNTIVGLFYLGTAFTFFLLAGVLALLMRTQLAVPENDFLGQDIYNQLFTMHGTVMMFLFAVPAIEALGVLLLPQMLAARDLPFPRLGAFAVWAYVIGGTVFFLTIFYDLSPKGGWFMYPPLTLTQFSPGDNADFWLLGIGFIEVSAIAGAIEIIVGTLRTRPPGMTLDKMPIFAWAMLIFAGMIVFAFPAIILATMLLELERAFGWTFFSPAGGGDPLLWQHLFWFFGHPEVYIIFLPAAGLVSMIVATMARRPLLGYRYIVIALIGTGFFSFALWVHHMFTTGLPALSLSFFSAASMAVAIPSGLQVFAWIATIAAARGRFSITTPSLFVLGFLFIFVMGGLTGVMVAMIPFDWQVHDTYFVVAHFHYVLVGGMVFPLFATFYYWAPFVSRRPLSESLGRWVFGLMFIGFNIAFFPMHLTGLLGMPRRVWTYGADMGWDTLNMTSTIGAFVLAAGIGLFVVDMIRRFRLGQPETPNPWQAGTLEWLPNDVYSTRSIPHVRSREPSWDQPDLGEQVDAGHHYLPDAPTGRRETLLTSAVDARPEYVIRMPGPGWSHFLAAVFTAAFFLLLTVKAVTVAAICGVLAIISMIVWTWELDPGPTDRPVRIAKDLTVPAYVTGPKAHGWWATIVLMLVAGSLYLSFMFSYLYLWTVSPEVWPGDAVSEMPGLMWPGLSLTGMASGAIAFALALRTLQPKGTLSIASAAWSFVGAACLIGGVTAEVWGHLGRGLDPVGDAHGAMTYMQSVLNGQIVFAVSVMALVVVARIVAGRTDRERRGTLEHTALLGWYASGQSVLGLLLIHGFPRLVA